MSRSKKEAAPGKKTAPMQDDISTEPKISAPHRQHAPHRGWFKVDEEAIRTIKKAFDKPSDARNAMAAYVVFCRKANLRGKDTFEDTIGNLAHDLCFQYRDAQYAIGLVEAIGLVKIERRKVPGTLGNAPSIYTLVRPGYDNTNEPSSILDEPSRIDRVHDEYRSFPKNSSKKSLKTTTTGEPVVVVKKPKDKKASCSSEQPSPLGSGSGDHPDGEDEGISSQLEESPKSSPAPATPNEEGFIRALKALRDHFSGSSAIELSAKGRASVIAGLRENGVGTDRGPTYWQTLRVIYFAWCHQEFVTESLAKNPKADVGGKGGYFCCNATWPDLDWVWGKNFVHYLSWNEAGCRTFQYGIEEEGKVVTRCWRTEAIDE